MAKASTCYRGFTLTETLIVIGIIVLILLIAVPALNVITGSRSIDGAENNVSAMLGRARADAIGVQQTRGVLFFIDPATQGVTLAHVQQVSPMNTGREVFLDLVPDQDFLALPKGVSAQVIDNCNVTGSTRADDGFIGFNQSAVTFTGDTKTSETRTTTLHYGGAILFNGKGQLTSHSYAFRGERTLPSGATEPTAIMNLLNTGKIDGVSPNMDDLAPNTFLTLPSGFPNPMRSQFGLVLFEREPFAANWNDADVQVSGGTYVNSTEPAEEQWIDQNATPLMVNRYNGTLIRGE